MRSSPTRPTRIFSNSSCVLRPSIRRRSSATRAASPSAALSAGTASATYASSAARRQLARRLDAGRVRRPERRDPAERLLAVLGRHVLARVGLGEGLVGADPEHVDLDAEALERVVEVEAVGGVADHADRAGRLEVGLVGLRHQVVLLLARVAAVGEHLLAALPEVLHRVADRAQLREPRAGHLRGVEHQRADALVLGRRADRVDDVAHQRLGLVVAGQHADRAVEGTAGELLDEAPLGAHDERGASRHERQRVARGGPDDREQEQQQREVQHPPQAVEEAPQTVKQPTDDAHVGSPSGARNPPAPGGSVSGRRRRRCPGGRLPKDAGPAGRRSGLAPVADL